MISIGHELRRAVERLTAGPWPATPREPDFRSREWLPESRDALVLDIGCGLGNRLAELHHWGYRRLVGVDVNPDVVAPARARLAITVLSGRVPLDIPILRRRGRGLPAAANTAHSARMRSRRAEAAVDVRRDLYPTAASEHV